MLIEMGARVGGAGTNGAKGRMGPLEKALEFPRRDEATGISIPFVARLISRVIGYWGGSIWPTVLQGLTEARGGTDQYQDQFGARPLQSPLS